MFYGKDCRAIYGYHQASGDVSERVGGRRTRHLLRIEVSLIDPKQIDPFAQMSCSVTVLPGWLTEPVFTGSYVFYVPANYELECYFLHFPWHRSCRAGYSLRTDVSLF